jgi:glucans biosynthesis protein
VIARRTFLKFAALLGMNSSPLLRSVLKADAALNSGVPKRFDYAWLKGQARMLAGKDYSPPEDLLPGVIASLDWDQYEAVRFRRRHALWADDGLAFRVEFFPRGLYYRDRVRMYEVVGGQAREIGFRSDWFELKARGLAVSALPQDLGFAGFRLYFHTDWNADLAAFLGASYFRAVSGTKQYGLSARGLAIDTGLPRPEEFPVFKAFWFERPDKGSYLVTVYALMDSPSVAGAYRFTIAPGPSLIMDVDAALYPRREIERLGVAPMSSMFLCGENDHRIDDDWRPQIHDSDGLALWTGAGERIWRPLVNPGNIRVNSYFDLDPQGFGLMQRDRNFDHYQDDWAFYERRPSLWVEPRKVANRGWGKGAVQLLEIPSNDETRDNIAAYWRPAGKPQPGQELLFAYRLHWSSKGFRDPGVAHVAATRTGIGGILGRKRTYFSWRFVVDFAGGDLKLPGKKSEVEPVITASRGLIELSSARPLEEIAGYRAMFDLKPVDDSVEPVDLRLYLRLGAQTLSETWSYQWTPPPAEERKHWLSVKARTLSHHNTV